MNGQIKAPVIERRANLDDGGYRVVRIPLDAVYTAVNPRAFPIGNFQYLQVLSLPVAPGAVSISLNSAKADQIPVRDLGYFSAPTDTDSIEQIFVVNPVAAAAGTELVLFASTRYLIGLNAYGIEDVDGRTIVVGPAANGAGATGNPVLVAGVDSNIITRRMLTSPAGRVATAPFTGTATLSDGEPNTAVTGAQFDFDTVRFYEIVSKGFGFNGSTWDRKRVSNIHKHVTGAALASGSPISVHTPASGKKFRCHMLVVSVSAAGRYLFASGGTASIWDLRLEAAKPNIFTFADGLLALAANDDARVYNTTGAPVDIEVFATFNDE